MNDQMVNEASALIKQGKRGKAKEILVDILKKHPTNEQAWMLLSRCVDSRKQKIYCVKKVLEINAENKIARQKLLHLKMGRKRRGLIKNRYVTITLVIGLGIFIGALALIGIYPRAKAAPAKSTGLISPEEFSHQMVSLIANTSNESSEVKTFVSSESDLIPSSSVDSLPLPDIPEAFCVPMDTQREYVKVLQVLSPDEIVVELNGAPVTVGYIGVDTSTLKDHVYTQATETNRTLEGQHVTLVQDETESTPDGVHPRYVFIGNTFVNYQLLAWGLGTPVNNPPDDSCAGFFLVAQMDAQDHRVGVWAPPLPSEWREWPVIPEITDFSQLVYATGLAVGNDPHSFSVIGDCQSLPDRFLGRVDWGSYKLPDGYAYLEPTIEWFSGDYSRNFITVRDSATVATMFSPLWADSDRCKSHETPLDCEFRLNNPSIVLISLGTNWRDRSVEEFERFLHEIVQFSLDQNVLPVIATKADATTSDYPLNHAMARVAYDFDIPLWNFWSAVQYMPYQGMDPGDARGIHILSSAYPLKRITALQVLNEIISSVESD